MPEHTIVVLLVDDQPFIGSVVRNLLAGEPDITFHYCGTALDAVAQANRVHPTVILQDLVLPDIDGLTLVRMFRENASTAGAVIIVLSGNDDEQTRTRAIAGGANDYLVKLPTKKDLVACIRRHAQPLSHVEHTVAVKHDPDQTLDPRAIAEFRSASVDFARSVIDRFIKEAESQVELISDARQRLDTPLVKATAHSLKGSSLTMGAGKLARLCGELETSDACSESRAAERDLVSEVDREFIKVRAALVIQRQEGLQS